ncbi:hypothetical protein [Tanticharoenia sakaeratensis]|uniref:Transmembrane protein n=1 Tax=Tanticharoenia sakaeratensis NBRC 103193 TaxID=1231623 RepID=A0A0D6MHS8_9PROT|nr:hypothetical protein [Tanticharoenia sakaeratensis]GAN53187.1 hypothetical protein Tasa_007_032 [Tanticharoenia sakaeratensis NBRC 103193]
MFADTIFSDPRMSAGRSRAYSHTDRDIILVVYALYALGFFTGITAVAGAVLAYHRRNRTLSETARGQLSWQIRLFWLGVLAWTAIGLVHGAVAALGAITGGIGLVFMIVPWGMIGLWGALTLWALARGLIALYRGRAIV